LIILWFLKSATDCYQNIQNSQAAFKGNIKKFQGFAANAAVVFCLADKMKKNSYYQNIHVPLI